MIRNTVRTAACIGVLFGLGATSAHADAWTINEMIGWAVSVEDLSRGPLDIANPGLGDASHGVEANVIGPALGDVNTTLSLGDGGAITLGFDPAIGDGPGDDFAVFENGFFSPEGLFAEFAFVEVSSNGVDFAALPAYTTNTLPVPSFGAVFPSEYEGFAGSEVIGLGTGFDLRDLWTDPLVTSGVVDLQDIGFVRLIDVVGDGSTLDDDDFAVYDPYPTPFPTGGFDLDGIGVRHVPEPSLGLGFGLGLIGLLGLARRRGARLRASMTSALLVLSLPVASAQAAHIVDFEDQGLPASSYYDGADLAGQFTSVGVDFENTHIPAWNYWYGFGASTMTDTTTPGYGNQYSAITGAGVGGSATYGLFFDDSAADPRAVLGNTSVLEGMYVTNTTYAYRSMLDGDPFSKQFGGPSGDDADFFLLTIRGYDQFGVEVANTVDFYLADFRDANNALDYIIDQWTWVDLSALGAVASLGFELSSSDVDPTYGYMNTPGYFAIDDLQLVPEPGTALLVGIGLFGLGMRRRA